MTCVLRPARQDELDALSALCLRSKAHWGYDDRFMAHCRKELRLTTARGVIVAEKSGTPAGIAQLTVAEGRADLELLYVAPEAMGEGLGRRLFDCCARTAKAQGATEMHIVADPHAAGFYTAMGAAEVGRAPSGSIPGRMLPKLICPL